MNIDDFLGDGMSMTKLQEAVMSDMFDDAERAQEAASEVLSGEGTDIDPDIMVELYLDSPLERTNMAVMMAKQLAKELTESHRSVFEYQEARKLRTSEPTVLHVSSDINKLVKLSPVMEQRLDLYSGRYLDFLSVTPAHLMTESLDQYFKNIEASSYKKDIAAFYNLNSDAGNVDIFEVHCDSLRRASEYQLSGPVKSQVLAYLDDASKKHSFDNTGMSGYSL